MLIDLDVEFWYDNRNGNALNHETIRGLPRTSTTTQDTRLTDREGSVRSRRGLEEEEHERDRERDRRDLHRRYRLRYDQERARYWDRHQRGLANLVLRRHQRRQQESEQEQEQRLIERDSVAEDYDSQQEEYDEKMPRGQRYEPLPQRPTSPIILSPIPQSGAPNYNYNSGVPTSLSSAAPSIVSIPNSPPPSFHTHSSPGTPRPSQAQLRGGHIGSTSGVEELWGVAASTVGGETLDGRSGMGSSNDYLATITGLRQRVEWLEESMGRLLLEREKSPAYTAQSKDDRTNCCVSFTDASADVEQAFLARGTNCCVSFSGATSANKRKERRFMVAALLIVIFLVCVTVGVVITARAGRVNRAVNAGVDKVAKMLE